MSWTIRKPGQGYWTRLLSGLGAAVLLLFGAVWLWNTLKAYIGDIYVIAAIALAPVLILGYLTFRWTAVKEKPVDFLIETDDEMKQVNWPSRREVIGSTIVVIVAIFLLVALLFDADQMFAALFASAGVLHLGSTGENAPLVLSLLGWAVPTAWVLAAVGFSALAYAIIRFQLLKHVVINRLRLENPAPTGILINTVMQSCAVVWLAFHAGALIAALMAVPQIQQEAKAQHAVTIAVWVVAGIAAVLLAVAIDHLTLRHHDEEQSGERVRTVGRSTGPRHQGGVLKSPALFAELVTNAICLAAAWGVIQAIGTQVPQ